MIAENIFYHKIHFIMEDKIKDCRLEDEITRLENRKNILVHQSEAIVNYINPENVTSSELDSISSAVHDIEVQLSMLNVLQDDCPDDNKQEMSIFTVHNRTDRTVNCKDENLQLEMEPGSTSKSNFSGLVVRSDNCWI